MAAGCLDQFCGNLPLLHIFLPLDMIAGHCRALPIHMHLLECSCVAEVPPVEGVHALCASSHLELLLFTEALFS